MNSHPYGFHNKLCEVPGRHPINLKVDKRERTGLKYGKWVQYALQEPGAQGIGLVLLQLLMQTLIRMGGPLIARLSQKWLEHVEIV